MRYEEFTKIVKNNGFTIKEFMDYVGMAQSSATKWKNSTVPFWVTRVFEGLEYKKELKSCEDRIKRMCKESD